MTLYDTSEKFAGKVPTTLTNLIESLNTHILIAS
jgi:hypothetical protein